MPEKQRGTKRIAIYPCAGMLDVIRAHTPPAGKAPNVSQTLCLAVTRYAEMTRRATPTMTGAEWMLILDASAGAERNSVAAVMGIPHSIADAIAMDGMAAKWGVDGPALVSRLQGMDYIALAAVAEVNERFWDSQPVCSPATILEIMQLPAQPKDVIPE